MHSPGAGYLTDSETSVQTPPTAIFFNVRFNISGSCPLGEANCVRGDTKERCYTDYVGSAGCQCRNEADMTLFRPVSTNYSTTLTAFAAGTSTTILFWENAVTCEFFKNYWANVRMRWKKFQSYQQNAVKNSTLIVQKFTATTIFYITWTSPQAGFLATKFKTAADIFAKRSILLSLWLKPFTYSTLTFF